VGEKGKGAFSAPVMLDWIFTGTIAPPRVLS
jgi:hypothetical protein